MSTPSTPGLSDGAEDVELEKFILLNNLLMPIKEVQQAAFGGSVARPEVTEEGEAVEGHMGEPLSNQKRECSLGSSDNNLNDGNTLALRAFDPAVCKLCLAVESILLHGLIVNDRFAKTEVKKSSTAEYGTRNELLWFSAYQLLMEISHKTVVHALISGKHVHTSLGRIRAWIVLALNENILDNYLDILFNLEGSVQKNGRSEKAGKGRLMDTFYYNHAILMDKEKRSIITDLLSGIECINFQLNIDNELFDEPNYFIDVIQQKANDSMLPPDISVRGSEESTLVGGVTKRKESEETKGAEDESSEKSNIHIHISLDDFKSGLTCAHDHEFDDVNGSFIRHSSSDASTSVSVVDEDPPGPLNIQDHNKKIMKKKKKKSKRIVSINENELGMGSRTSVLGKEPTKEADVTACEKLGIITPLGFTDLGKMNPKEVSVDDENAILNNAIAQLSGEQQKNILKESKDKALLETFEENRSANTVKSVSEENMHKTGNSRLQVSVDLREEMFWARNKEIAQSITEHATFELESSKEGKKMESGAQKKVDGKQNEGVGNVEKDDIGESPLCVQGRVTQQLDDLSCEPLAEDFMRLSLGGEKQSIFKRRVQPVDRVAVEDIMYIKMHECNSDVEDSVCVENSELRGETGMHNSSIEMNGGEIPSKIQNMKTSIKEFMKIGKSNEMKNSDKVVHINPPDSNCHGDSEGLSGNSLTNEQTSFGVKGGMCGIFDSSMQESDSVENLGFALNEEEKDQLISHLLAINGEMGLDSQDYRCIQCRERIGLSYRQSYFCNFDGMYYCGDCFHFGESIESNRNVGDDIAAGMIAMDNYLYEYKSVIISRVIKNWDFRVYSISKRSYEFIQAIRSRPLFDVSQVNPYLLVPPKCAWHCRDRRETKTGSQVNESNDSCAASPRRSIFESLKFSYFSSGSDASQKPKSDTVLPVNPCFENMIWDSNSDFSFKRAYILREECYLMLNFIRECTLASNRVHYIQGELFRFRPHLMKGRRLLSLADLMDIFNGSLCKLFKKAIASAEEHISNCIDCKSRGTMCNVCKEEAIVYPFKKHKAISCSACKRLVHVGCSNIGKQSDAMKLAGKGTCLGCVEKLE
eukprot:Nk52_evm4s338 gene=Nk52_evmTU4s338